jgi:hypothetical protein
MQCEPLNFLLAPHITTYIEIAHTYMNNIKTSRFRPTPGSERQKTDHPVKKKKETKTKKLKTDPSTFYPESGYAALIFAHLSRSQWLNLPKPLIIPSISSRPYRYRPLTLSADEDTAFW